MGCCSVNHHLDLPKHSRFASQIESDPNFKLNSSDNIPQNIDDPIIIINNLTLNPLGVALWQGSLQNFRNLIQINGAKCEAMEILLEKQEKNGLEVLIENGHFEMFKFYLPMFTLNSKSSSYLQKPLVSKAIIHERLDILKHIFKYFIHVKPPPAFNFHFFNRKTGENPALVASRCLNLDIIKFLNHCGCNFRIRNSKKETALQVAVRSMKNKGFDLEIFRYLIEKCKVDFISNWKTICLNLEDLEVLEYYKRTLEKVDKEVKGDVGVEVEEKNLEVELTAVSFISADENEDFMFSY